MVGTSLDGTYGVWLVSLFVETLLYGIGFLQTYEYFAHLPTDPAYIKSTVLGVFLLETIQIVFFFFSSYDRFVNRFGKLQLDLIWADSLQLLAAYLGAFVVQIYFAHRIHRLTKGRRKFSIQAFGIYTILAFALVSIVAGIAQTVTSYHLRSYLKLDQTKFITTIQAASSLSCDLLITIYLCVFLKHQKGDFTRTNTLMDSLMHDAINRGTLTALSSAVNMILFLALPNTFWFFLGLAPSSKLYMNSMLATLNRRDAHRAKMAAASGEKAWTSIPGLPIPMRTVPSGGAQQLEVQVQVETEKMHDHDRNPAQLVHRDVDFTSSTTSVDVDGKGCGLAECVV